MRTNDHKSNDRIIRTINNTDLRILDVGGIIMACMGLSGEVGELVDMMKKVIFHEAEYDDEHAIKELGDVLWYCAMMCESMGWDMETVMAKNITKLEHRYPDGFDPDRANHRKPDDV